MMGAVNIYFANEPGVGLIMVMISFIRFLSFSLCLLSTYCVLDVS